MLPLGLCGNLLAVTSGYVPPLSIILGHCATLVGRCGKPNSLAHERRAQIQHSCFKAAFTINADFAPLLRSAVYFYGGHKFGGASLSDLWEALGWPRAARGVVAYTARVAIPWPYRSGIYRGVCGHTPMRRSDAAIFRQ
ncbi:hypothetical protein SAMN04488523_101418 [Sulfitobacter brevis]|uniref:Uncharacterized protein n=1 Tax=Sulfitobacter brevis TaxID=74348 RepID=A0A1I1TK71_9RHOB|nr:hypothetical protein SAMN04488523_101418 [Sulfitobacter brevis]